MNIKKLLISIVLLNAIIIDAQDLPTIIKNGFNKIKANDFAGAEQDFSAAIKLNDGAVNKYLEKMKKYSSMNAFEIATSDMPDGFIHNHDYAVPFYGRGVALEGQGKTDAAIADYEKSILIEPKYADALCQYGLMLFSKGVKDKGCVNLQKAKSLGSEKAKTLYGQNDCKSMGTAFLTSGNEKLQSKDIKGALEDFTNGIKLNNEVYELYLKRAECFRATKQYDKAISDIDKALKTNPDTVKMLLLRGTVYNEMQSFKLAFEDFTRVIKLNPNVYDSYIQRGASCEGMQNFVSAEYDYSEAIRLKPNEGMPYYKRGIVTQDMKNNKSCKDFKIAASLGYEDAKNLADGCQ